MLQERLTVQDNMVVTLAYTLRLKDGRVVESSEESEPITFIQGAGEILPGLEEAVYGMTVGEEKEIWLAPEDAYGPRRADAYQVVPRSEFPADFPLAPGIGLYVYTENGEAFPAYIAEVGPDTVTLDFNHPLAGEELHFTVKILALRPATPKARSGSRLPGLQLPDPKTRARHRSFPLNILARWMNSRLSLLEEGNPRILLGDDMPALREKRWPPTGNHPPDFR